MQISSHLLALNIYNMPKVEVCHSSLQGDEYSLTASVSQLISQWKEPLFKPALRILHRNMRTGHASLFVLPVSSISLTFKAIYEGPSM